MNFESNQSQKPNFHWVNSLALIFFLIVVSLVVSRIYFFRHIPGQSNEATKIGLLRFHNEVYYPVRAFITGENPLDSSEFAAFHPDTEYGTATTLKNVLPSTLLQYCVVGFFQLRYAEAIFIGLSIAITCALSYLLLRQCTNQSPGLTGMLFCSGLMLLSLPGTELFFTCPATMISVFGAALALTFSGPKAWLGSIGLLLASVVPAIGIPIFILILLRGNAWVVIGGLTLLATANAIAIGYMTHNGGPAFNDPSYWSALDYRTYITYAANPLSQRSPIGLDLFGAIKAWGADGLTLDRSLLLPASLLVLGGLSLWSERAANHRNGIISRSGILVCLIALLAFPHTVDVLMLLWIAVVAIVTDGARSKQAFSVGFRFMIGMLLVLPLFNYFGTPFVMEKLKIGPAWIGAPEADGLVSLRMLLERWGVPEAVSVEWNIVSTFNICLIALAALLVMLRMITSSFFKDRFENASPHLN